MTKKQNFFNKTFRKINFKFKNNPQLKGVVDSVRIQTPRKPNSARRKVVKNRNYFNLFLISSVNGGEHNLKKHNSLLVKGNGARDLPGVYSSGIRGVYDLVGLKKTKRRSIYGFPLEK